MEKILFMEQSVDEYSSNLGHAIEIAKNKGAELSALFFIPVLLETADWIEVQEKQIRDAEDKAKRFARKTQDKLQEDGLSFKWKVVQAAPDAMMEAIQACTPVDVIIAGKVDLEPLSEKGVKHLEDISARFNCPVLPVVSLLPAKRKLKGKMILRFLAFGALSAVSYFVFFPHLDKFNHSIYMKGTILGALAVMVTVPVHAYIYGSFTEYFPKFLGLEKSAGTDH